jgi:hypothetical protein
MKPYAVLLFGLILLSNNTFCQTLETKPTRMEIGSYNQGNLIKIDLGVTKNKVLEVMGGVQKIQTYTEGNFLTRKESITINNPYGRDFKTDTSGNTIEILWYYTDVNKSDGVVSKSDQTPILLEKNAVIGMGWPFYEDYAKRKGIAIDEK